jgi:hypothetical protein
MITIHDPEFTQAWEARLSRAQLNRLDNGHLVSIGLVVGEDITPTTLKRWEKVGKAIPIDPEKGKHSGCQSRCVLRGDSICQW